MASFLFHSLTLLRLAQNAQASSFKPNCTIPSPGTNYVSGPNVRGTTTILWNCLSIIFLCTWNIQHLNVPAQRPKAKGVFQGIWWAILDSRKKIKWMIFTILVPEYLVGKAFGEKLAARRGARRGVRRGTNIFEADNAADIEWDEKHVYMANMGYFVVDFSDVLKDDPATLKKLVDEVHQSSPNISTSVNIAVSRLQHRCWALNHRQLLLAVKCSLIDIPEISSQQLTKLDRGDKLAKALALVQIIYLIVQLIARKVVELPSTQLEIAALAFSASSMITYVLYWSRPQGVDGVHIIKAKKLPGPRDLTDIAFRGPAYFWTHARTRSGLGEELDLVPLPNDGADGSFMSGPFHEFIWRIMQSGSGYWIRPIAFSALAGGTLFGGLHCLAWDFQFPTSNEQLTWRICSVLTSGLPILSIAPMAFWLQDSSKMIGPINSGFVAGATLIVLLVIYVLARLFLIVEMFRSLFFLPPEAFIDTWSGSFPHFG